MEVRKGLHVGRITAIVPTFNRAALLEECLHSILAQERPVSEIIIVDDGSGDATAEVACRTAGPIRYLRQENRGKAAALNLGLSEATGDYIWICDDDDLALPHATEVLAQAIDARSHAFAYGGYLRFSTEPGSGRRIYRGPGYWPADAEDLFSALLDDFFMFQFATLVRREAYQALGPFKEGLIRSQDYDMALRLAQRFTGVYVPRVVFLQRDHADARGAAQHRFGSRERFAKWIEFDQQIFRELRLNLPLWVFEPRDCPDAEPAVRRRIALLKRSCVFARKALWDYALVDLRAAIALGGEARPEPRELEIASRMLLGKYGCVELIRRPELLTRLIQECSNGAYAHRLLTSISRPLLWRARAAAERGQFQRAGGYLAALSRMQGIGGLFGALGRAMVNRGSKPDRAMPVIAVDVSGPRPAGVTRWGGARSFRVRRASVDAPLSTPDTAFSPLSAGRAPLD